MTIPNMTRMTYVRRNCVGRPWLRHAGTVLERSGATRGILSRSVDRAHRRLRADVRTKQTSINWR